MSGAKDTAVWFMKKSQRNGLKGFNMDIIEQMVADSMING